MDILPAMALPTMLGTFAATPFISIIFIFFGWMVQNADRIIDNIDYCTKTLGFDGFFRGKTLSLDGKIIHYRYTISCSMSDELKGILYFLQKNLDKLTGIHKVMSIDIATSQDVDNRKVFLVPVQSKWIRATRDIDVRVKYQKEKVDSTGKIFAETTSDSHMVTVTIRSRTATVQQLQQFIAKCKEEYRDFQASGSGTQMCFSMSMIEDSDKDLPIFTPTPFISSKNIDNTFFDGRDKLVKMIHSFEDPVERKKRDAAGIPNTLGMLFHGRPGTGKTSFIKAIANLTKRHVIIIKMDALLLRYGIKSIDVLETIMKSLKIGDLEVPQSKRLYVFEEADSWQEFLKQRIEIPSSFDSQTHNNKKRSADGAGELKELIETALNGSHKTQAASPFAATSATPASTTMLGRFLELMDGVDEMYGRMCIMTTNHPEKLEKALVRAGRFGDIVHEFGNLSRAAIVAILQQWFNRHIPEYERAAIQDDTWTQSDIGKFLKQHQTYEDVLDSVCCIPEPPPPKSPTASSDSPSLSDWNNTGNDNRINNVMLGVFMFLMILQNHVGC